MINFAAPGTPITISGTISERSPSGQLSIHPRPPKSSAPNPTQPIRHVKKEQGSAQSWCWVGARKRWKCGKYWVWILKLLFVSSTIADISQHLMQVGIRISGASQDDKELEKPQSASPVMLTAYDSCLQNYIKHPRSVWTLMFHIHHKSTTPIFS